MWAVLEFQCAWCVFVIEHGRPSMEVGVPYDEDEWEMYVHIIK